MILYDVQFTILNRLPPGSYHCYGYVGINFVFLNIMSDSQQHAYDSHVL